MIGSLSIFQLLYELPQNGAAVGLMYPWDIASWNKGCSEKHAAPQERIEEKKISPFVPLGLSLVPAGLGCAYFSTRFLTVTQGAWILLVVSINSRNLKCICICVLIFVLHPHAYFLAYYVMWGQCLHKWVKCPSEPPFREEERHLL